MNISKNIKLVRVATAQAAGQTTITSDACDTAGFETVCLVVSWGAIVSGAATSMRLHGSDSASSGFVVLSDSKYTVAADYDDQLVYIECPKPAYRYLKLVITRDTQNSTVDGIIALLWGAGETPVTHDAATVAGGECFRCALPAGDCS